MEKLKIYIKDNENKILIFIFIIIGAFALLRDLSYNGAKTEKTGQEPSSIDTLIPEGYVLAPIEIENFDSLNSMLGAYGVVDIYSNTLGENKYAHKLVKNVKIMRAPLNKEKFAILIQEDQASSILKEQGPYFVMIQNPKNQKTEFKENISKNIIISEATQ